MKRNKLIILPIIIFIIERVSNNAISKSFSKISCGDNYLNKIDGRLSDSSCGFNADIQLVAILFLILIVGIILSLFRRRKSSHS
jgi:hypothetical protein